MAANYESVARDLGSATVGDCLGRQQQQQQAKFSKGRRDSRKWRGKNVCHVCYYCPFNLLLVLKSRANYNSDSNVSFPTSTRNTLTVRDRTYHSTRSCVQTIRSSPKTAVTPAWRTILLRYILVSSPRPTAVRLDSA